MRLELTDYQRDAAALVLDRLSLGKELWRRRDPMPSSFALSAITGAGKTVIATAVIEAAFHGSSDLGVDADPEATFLWITDDPALNRQTRAKMLDASDLLVPARLVELADDFMERELLAGRVYFLNTQKLSKAARLVQSDNNLRQASFWDILANTIGGGRAHLTMVLDEAHRGMRRTADRTPIVQRLIHGQTGSNPPVPVVWGISATIDRFVTAMGEAPDRMALPHVAVDLARVQQSGLIKDAIGLDQPDERSWVATTLLRNAVLTALDFERRWAAYSLEAGEPEVLPVLVVQVPDKADERKLAELLQVVESAWPGLGPRAVAHVFGEHEPIVLGSRTIAWVPPESIQGDTDIRVVLAKEAISTGWDCPRAEVLYSERPAVDATHIAQVIGRMVRQPLAHRIATDDALNSVSCYLPLFDREKLTAIKDELEGKGVGNGQHAVGSQVLRAPVVFDRNPELPPEVFELIESLPSTTTPEVGANPLRRAKQLVRLLADDVSGRALLPDADEQLLLAINRRLDGLAAERRDEVAAVEVDLRTIDVRRTEVDVAGGDRTTSVYQLVAHAKDVDRETRRTINGVREGVGKAHYAYRVATAGDGADRLDIRISVAALLRVPGVVAEVEAVATRFVQEQLGRFAVEIRNTTGAIRDAYRKVQEQASTIEEIQVELRANERAATKAKDGTDLPRYPGHLYADDAGLFPAELNEWERAVVTAEVARPSFVAWYRNPARATPNSLRIAYEDFDGGVWRSLQVDFLVVSRLTDGRLGVSIVDPHGDHLADAKAKLQALADYADRYGDQFVRIDAVADGSGGQLMALDLREPAVRRAVLSHPGDVVSPLFDSDHARPFQ